MADDTLLVAEIAQLRAEIERFNGHKFIQAHNSVRRMIFLQLLRGLAFGLGTVLGATILVSVVGYLLSSIDFVPILGELAADIIKIIDTR